MSSQNTKKFNIRAAHSTRFDVSSTFITDPSSVLGRPKPCPGPAQIAPSASRRFELHKKALRRRRATHTRHRRQAPPSLLARSHSPLNLDLRHRQLQALFLPDLLNLLSSKLNLVNQSIDRQFAPSISCGSPGSLYTSVKNRLVWNNPTQTQPLPPSGLSAS